jgi:ribonucleoside-diphosphate reductase alpha chain
MVTLDADHPDVENFIAWKAREEHKVASMVTGSHIIKSRLDEIRKALSSFRGPEADKFNVQKNRELQAALQNALRDQVPPSYLYQLLHNIKCA